MTLSSHTKQTIFRSSLVGLLLITSLAYGYLQSRNLVRGPSITVLSPVNGSSLDNQLVTISGKTKNIAEMSLNDRQIFPDENGNFTETLVLPVGYTIMSLKAEDKFGKKTEQSLSLTVNNKRQEPFATTSTRTL